MEVGRPEDLDSLNDAEIADLAQNLTRGVPFATPVFDGATEEEIKGMLELAGLPVIQISRARDLSRVVESATEVVRALELSAQATRATRRLLVHACLFPGTFSRVHFLDRAL